MQQGVSKDMIEKWLRGWCLSRQLPLPTQFRTGLKVEVGFEKQKTRYVFPCYDEDFVDMLSTIVEPWVFLKVCAPSAEFQSSVPPRWLIQPQAYMMTCVHPMVQRPLHLHDEYRIEYENYNSTYHVKLFTNEGQLAADGRVVLVDDLAVFDRISTAIDHRRKGLATFLMLELEKVALSKGISKNFLVATEEGTLLYHSLGWKLYCLYTSMVIAG